jgi:hypothetical protein
VKGSQNASLAVSLRFSKKRPGRIQVSSEFRFETAQMCRRISSDSIISKNLGAWFHRGLGQSDEGAALSFTTCRRNRTSR